MAPDAKRTFNSGEKIKGSLRIKSDDGLESGKSPSSSCLKFCRRRKQRNFRRFPEKNRIYFILSLISA
jgi:hypothetical protein